MDLVVQKYGGSSLKTPEDIRRVAKQVAEIHHGGTRVIVVVSAMGTATDELVQLAYQISPRPNRRELDMLLTAGERVSMALMSMALHDLYCPSISFTGSQAGVLTDTSHSNARIQEIKPIRVEESLEQGKVVVLAGFQGVDPVAKEVTTLGRGGSDTTAVAMAAHFKAKRCEILKDVDGIFSADPKLIPHAKHYGVFPFAAIEDACFWGAKVLHFRSVELARTLKVPLYVGSSLHPEKGTIIQEEVPEMYEKVIPLTVNSLNEVHHLSVQCENPAEGMQLLEKELKQHQLAWPQILATVYEEGRLRMMVSTSAEQMKALLQTLTSSVFKSIREPLTGVTLTCSGLYSSNLPEQILGLLQQDGLAPVKTLSTGTSFSVFVKPDEKERTVRALHHFIEQNS
ncbi:MAG: aspartate kinase [Bdellovibrionaceae bacterium]|nr:aspartate kinase [Bdellovibrionales bacterium]MCB9084888.1 aspartate kinase [Pseudobdellovibrionaceae bacterium]